MIKKIIAIFKIIIVICILYACGMAAFIISGAWDHLFKADLIVVLGNKAHRDGTPTGVLRARLNTAIHVYRSGYAPYIMVSGGTGREGVDESLVMKNYLIQHGIPENIIIQDGQGVNTRATAYNAAEYMRAHHFTSVIIVSQYFHIRRSELAFRNLGITNIGYASPLYFTWEEPYSLAREIVGYPAYLLHFK